MADPVGAGKTSQLGEVIRRAITENDQCRILILAKASQIPRLQTELREEFGLYFFVYKDDFSIRAAYSWNKYDLVIASIDQVKPKHEHDCGGSFSTHFGKILAGGSWDIVAVDEAHHTAHPDGDGATLTFTLVAALRARAKRMFLLTGTPHVGDRDRFCELLKLARPDLAASIDDPEFFDSAVAQSVFRTRKIDVTDCPGNFIIKGEQTHLLKVPPRKPQLILEAALERYLSDWTADDEDRCEADDPLGPSGFRKLLASSVAALDVALRHRLKNIEGRLRLSRGNALKQAQSEARTLRNLIHLSEKAVVCDPKLRVVLALHEQYIVGAGRKILIFTQFLATQAWLQREFLQLSGQRPVIINGEQTTFEKEEALRAFNDDVDVIISTEAGSEGFNIQQACHIIVNWDLAWLPTRHMQHAGRLSRIGQSHRVLVLNITSDYWYDEHIIARQTTRLKYIARDLASVTDDPDEWSVEQVLGTRTYLGQLQTILKDVSGHCEYRSPDRIEYAAQRAASYRPGESAIAAE